MRKKRALAYLRVSTEEQADSKNGLQAQRDAIRSYCEKVGLSFDDRYIFEDGGVSGAADLTDRPALLRCLKEMRKGDVLIVSYLDRLSRDSDIHGMIRTIVKKKGASVVYALQDHINGESSPAMMVRGMEVIVSEQWRQNIRVRTRDALQARKTRLMGYSPTPYGYTRVSFERGPQVGTRRGELLDPRLVPNEEEQKVLARIREVYAECKSYRRVSEMLNAEKVPAKKGGKWYPMTIRDLVLSGRAA